MGETGYGVVDIALSMYAHEPCRICGRELLMADIKNGAVFAGYNADDTSRSAHRRCWYGVMDIVQSASDTQIHEWKKIDISSVWGDE